MELITSDELAVFVKDALLAYNQEDYIDGAAEEFFEISDITREGHILTVTTMNTSKTRTLTFNVVIHGGV